MLTNPARRLGVLFTTLFLTAGCAADPAGRGATSLGVEVVQVGDRDLADLADGATYLVDLTADDVVFRIDAPADLADDRVLVRTTAGHEIVLGELLGDHAVAKERRRLTLAGDPNDIDALRRGVPAHTAPGEEEVGASRAELRAIGAGGTGCSDRLSYSCSLWSCSCSGDTDCNDMFCSGVCGGDAVCIEIDGHQTCTCWRWSSLRAVAY